MEQARPSVYQAQPPTWLPQTHRSADLGFTGYDPPRPGQDEDSLSRANVRDGYTFRNVVSAETYSAQKDMCDRLNQESAIESLENLMNQVFARRADDAPAIAPYTFRIPSRVTVNDVKRQAWFSELANPEVPLHKLGKNVPHGAKNHDLLDLLYSYNVSIPRAVWFLRVFGANETTGLRNKSAYNPTQYSIEWTAIVTGYLKRQIAEVTLPTASRLGLGVKVTFKGVLAEPESRQKWLSRFTYSVQLLRRFYDEGLVDSYTFLSWAVQQLSISNLAQAGFVLRLTDEYLEDLFKSRILTRPYVDACILKLHEIGESVSTNLDFLQTELETHMRKACAYLPDAFVSPGVWLLERVMFEEVLSGESPHSKATLTTPEEIELQAALLENMDIILHRIKSLLFYNAAPAAPTDLYAAMLVVLRLNATTFSTDLREIAFRLFGDHAQDDYLFAQKLDLLLSWSTTASQFGDHRPYIAVAILDHWRNSADERARRRNVPPSYEFLQDRLFDWLDTCELAEEQDTVPAVANLLGKLAEKSLFSFNAYMERLIARNESGLAISDVTCSRHRELLRTIPLAHADPALFRRRKMILFGLRVRETPEDEEERKIRSEFRSLFSIVFDQNIQAVPLPTSRHGILAECPTFWSASLFIRSRVISKWLVPKMCTYLCTLDSVDTVGCIDLCVAVLILSEYAQSFESVLQVCITMLRFQSSRKMLAIAVVTLREYMEVWTAIGELGRIDASISDVHAKITAHGLPTDRSILGLLQDLHSENLDDERQTAQPQVSQLSVNVPAVLPEILLLAQDDGVDAPAILATTLWSRYGSSPTWVLTIWDNTVASLRQIPGMTLDEDDRRTRALRYASFLLHIDSLLHRGLDLTNWFAGPGRRELAALENPVWDLLNQVFLYLCSHGSLVVSDILTQVVYPIWAATAAVDTADISSGLTRSALPANRLFEALLLDAEVPTHTASVISLADTYNLHAQRKDVHRSPHFVQLLRGVITLNSMEQNTYLPDEIRQSSKILHSTLIIDNLFRQGLYAEYERLRPNSRDSSREPDDDDMIVDFDPAERASLFQTIRSYLSTDALCDIKDVDAVDLASCPWKLAMSGVALQMALQQANSSDDNISSAAYHTLDAILAKFLHKSMTAEEADFIAGVARGADGTVAKKFLDLGIKCITENIRDVTPSSLAVPDEHFDSAAEIFRLLTRVIQPIRERNASMPSLASDVQDGFAPVLRDALEKALTALLETPTEAQPLVSSAQLTEWTVFLVRLLQFVLGAPGVWTTVMKEQALALCHVIFKLLLVFADGPRQHTVAFAVVVDTFYFLVDASTTEFKSTDPAQFYPKVEDVQLSSNIPPEHKTKILSLLPHIERQTEVKDLVYATRDTSGAMTLLHNVQRRPWEWTEYPGEQAPSETGDSKSGCSIVRNAASLSLEQFDAHSTGESIHAASADRDVSLAWAFEDGLSSDSLFVRAFRETRLGTPEVVSDAHQLSTGEDELHALPTFPRISTPGASTSRPGSRGTSPASSVHSRMSYPVPAPGGGGSLPGSATSARFSPAQLPFSRGSVAPMGNTDTPGSAGGVLPTVMGTAKRAEKRKAEEEDDDDVIIVDPPQTASRSKKEKGKTAARTKMQKR